MIEINFHDKADQPKTSILRLVVLIPCYNEEASIGKVVKDFQTALPNAKIFVYDNNSTDRTKEIARSAGAIVRNEPLQGKGNVIRRMFADIESDVYVLVDGDDTYDAASAPLMIQKLVQERLDMINAARIATQKEVYRVGHEFGNMLFTKMVAKIFGSQFSDMLSGYRVFSRRFVKSFPALSGGFEIETELTVHALELQMPVMEIQSPYKVRAKGSVSKLRTFYDGFRILKTIFILTKEERPLKMFSIIFFLLFWCSILLAWPIVIEFMKTGLVPRIPTAVLSTGMMLLGFLSLACGLILDTVTHGRREIKRINYLRFPPASE